MKRNLMSGLRLTSGGVHLGHYLGCLSPLDAIESGDPLYFVIRDRGIDINKSDNVKNLIDILIDLSATKYGDRLKFVLQSELLSQSGSIYDYLQDIITLNQLRQIHPHRYIIKKSEASIRLKDFLFPIESICTYFLLNADKVLMNDDNIQVVRFAHTVSKKISSKIGVSLFPQPVLMHGNLPRLLGYNYKKVCKSNNNAIFLSDNKESVEKKLNKLLSFRYLFKTNLALASEREKLKEEFIIPDNYLPFQYFYAFFGGINCNNDIFKLNKYRDHDELSFIFKKEMHHFLNEIRERRYILAQNPKVLLDKLYADTLDAKRIAENMVNLFDKQIKV